MSLKSVLEVIRMSSLDRLMAQEIEKEVQGVKLKIKPLAGKEDLKLLAALNPNSKPEELADALWKIFEKQMKYNFPEGTQELLEKIPISIFQEVINATLEASGINIEEKQELLKQFGKG